MISFYDRYSNMKISYRPEIDGLRAVAVFVVIFYHAQISIFEIEFFKGGFVGVDIFFVISGYLITSIIAKELITTGKFSFKNFYERRIRRILPALLFVILTSLPFAWKYLLSGSFIDFSKSILYSLGFSSNFYFHWSGQSYDAENSLLKPFLHTWSLSVEEQFYIIFPVIFLILYKYFKKYLLHIVMVILLLSLIISDWGSKKYVSATFYLLHTRMWELLAGSVLGYLEIKLGHRSKSKTLNLILPSIGFFLIGLSVVFFNEQMFHPSLFTLCPVIGVCLIIWFSNKDEIFTRILSTKPFVGLGLISYSLYLWHYPIFAFGRIKGGAPSQYDKFEWIILTIFLSLVSYFLIERFFRNKNNNFKKIGFALSIMILVITLFNINILNSNKYQNRFTKLYNFNFNLLNEFEIFKETNDFKKYCTNEMCKYNLKKKNNIILIGDSHARTLLPGLFNFAKQNNIGLISSIVPGCGFILNTNRIIKKTGQIRHNCSAKKQLERFDLINDYSKSIVISFFRLPLILEESMFKSNLGYEGDFQDYIQNNKKNLKTKIERQKFITKNLKLTITKVLQNGHNFIIVYPYPEVGIHVPNQLIKLSKEVNQKTKFLDNSKILTDFDLFIKRTKSSFKILDEIQFNRLKKIKPHEFLCDNFIKNKCITHDMNNIYYFDDDHPSNKGAEIINNSIIKEIKKFN